MMGRQDAYQIGIDSYGSADALRMFSRAVPPPAAGEVRVRQTAVGVNFADIYFGSFENAVGNAAHEACGLMLEKSSLPAMRNSTVRMVLKLAYPRALRLAA